MREIEFRGKRIDNGEWVYGSLIKITNPLTEHTYYQITYAEDWNAITVKEETIGQYPCLKDKNGTKIFEGDLIKSKYKDVYQVYYEDNALKIEDKWGNGLKPIQRAITHFECEIIGNIYDNPELVKGK